MLPSLRTSRFAVVAVLAATLLAGALAAEEPLIANRPGFSNVWEVVPVGDLELNSGLQLTRIEDEESVSFGQVLIRAGVAEGIELRLGLNSWVEVDRPGADFSGLEDAFLGIKLALFSGSGELGWGRPDASLILQSTVPTGAAELTADKVQPSAILALAWNPAAGLHLDSNLGIASRIASGRRVEEITASHALGVTLVGDLAAYLEWAGFFPLEDSLSESHYLFAALTHLPSSRMQLDIGVGRGLDSADPDHFVSAGIAYRW